MFVVEVFLSSADLGDPEPDSSQSTAILSEMGLQSCQNLVGVKTAPGEKFDDDPLLQVHQNKCSMSFTVLSAVI
jgi:hypothetical protein